MATKNYETFTVPRVYLSAQTPGKHKADSRLAGMISSALPAALLAAMVPVLAAGCTTGAVLACALAASVVWAAALGAANAALPDKREVSYAAFGVALAAALAMLAVPPVREGLFSLYNGVVFRFDEAYGAYVGLVSSGQLVAASPLFGICFGLLSGSLAWAATRLRTSSVTLVSVVVLCGGAVKLGCGMSLTGVGLGLCAWLSQCRLGQLRGSSYSPAHVVAGVAVNLALCAAFIALCGALYAPNATVAKLYSSFEQSVEQARYGSDTLPEGNLAKAPAMNNGNDERLVLSVNGQVSDNLLLQGFTGATFENGTWQPLSHTAYEGDWQGVMPWLNKQGFVPAEQRAAYNTESVSAGQDETETATISVNSEGANSKYLYTPYTLRSLSAGETGLDGTPTSGFVGTRSYQFTMDNVSPSNVFADTGWLANSTSSYASAESVYAAFVRANYLEVSSEEAEAANRYIFNEATWDASAATSEYAVISRVRTMLDTLASYSETPNAPTNNEPFTQWFLGEARSGNSAYFATAATFALRSQGIPTRYVEGYRAEASDVANAARNGSSLTLDAGNAHAWVEVYLNGAGWTPIEVTPGFYSQNLEADQVIDVNEARSNGSGDIMQTESVMGQMEEEEQDNPTSPESIVLHTVASLASILLALMLVVLLAFVQRWIRIAHRNRTIASEQQEVSVPALFNYLALALSETGVRFDQTRPLDCADSFGRFFPGIDAAEYRRVVTLHQAYAFGGHELKPNEMRTLRRFTERVHAALPASRTATQRLKRFFVKAL